MPGTAHCCLCTVTNPKEYAFIKRYLWKAVSAGWKKRPKPDTFCRCLASPTLATVLPTAIRIQQARFWADARFPRLCYCTCVDRVVVGQAPRADDLLSPLPGRCKVCCGRSCGRQGESPGRCRRSRYAFAAARLSTFPPQDRDVCSSPVRRDGDFISY